VPAIRCYALAQVVQLASPSFNYSRVTRLKEQAIRNASGKFPDTLGKRLRQGLPPKLGSMQVFVNGYKDAGDVMKTWNWGALSEEFKTSFQVKQMSSNTSRATATTPQHHAGGTTEPASDSPPPTARLHSWLILCNPTCDQMLLQSDPCFDLSCSWSGLGAAQV